ncbi:MAG: GDSL-type esterase/lipase family protein [Maribacter sp.]
MNRRTFVTTTSLGALGTLFFNCADANRIQLKKNLTIACLGDSITATKDGYVQMLQDYVDNNHSQLNLKFLNWGKSSETITGFAEKNHLGKRPYLFERLDDLLASAPVDIILFCYGTNCGIYGKPSPELFDSYTIGIYSFLEKIKQKGTNAILLTPPPLVLETTLIPANLKQTEYGYTNPYPNYENEVLMKFCGIIGDVNHSNVLGIVDIHTPLLNHREKCYADDPIHPNKNGHQLITNTIIDHLTI